MAERAKVFEASSEGESLSGFEKAFSSEMVCFFVLILRSLMLLRNGGYYTQKNISECVLRQMYCVLQRVDSESEESVTPRKRGRRSQTLKVAMKFPTRRASQKKTIAAEPPKQPKVAPKQTTDEGDNFMDKRALNIRENKAMVRQNHSEKSLWL